MSKQFGYIISIIAILVIAHCPVLRADDDPNLVILDFEDLIEAVYIEDDTFQTSIATVTVEPLQLPGQGQSQDPNQYVNVSDTNFAGGTGNEIGEIRNLSLDFDFGVSVDSLEFLFYQHSPLLNIYVNGEMVIFDHFEDINDFNIGGAAVSVIKNDPEQGELKLTGTIYSFKIGGAQLLIDDMAVTLAGVTTYFVDVDGNDSNPGLDKETAFATIQKAIGTARDNEIVAVYPGTYVESISFIGKPITLQAESDPPVIQASGTIAVSFTSGDLEDTILQNLIIENSETGIFCQAGSPTIRNLTIVGNGFGIKIHDGSSPNIYNCILWDNNGDISLDGGDDSGISYCCSQQSLSGLGNISSDPMFVESGYYDDNFTPDDPNDDFYVTGDYHLRSSGWRWSDDPLHGSNWYFDDEGTSRCIDAGIPSYGVNWEPLTVAIDAENKWGANIRVNMGAYGGTARASMPPHGHAFLADIDNSGVVNGYDLLVMTGQWLESGIYLPADLSRDGNVNLLDFSLFASEWGNMNEWGGKINFSEYWPLEVGAEWRMEPVGVEEFSIRVSAFSIVNEVEVWELTNTHKTDVGTDVLVENRFSLDGVLYSVQDPNHLQTLPSKSENYKALYKESMVYGEPFNFEGSAELTPICGSLAFVLQNSAMTVEDFPGGGNYDVLALFENYGLPGEKIIAIFGKGDGPLYIGSENAEGPFIVERLRYEY